MDRLTLRKAGPHDSEFVFRTRKAAFREYVDKVWGWEDDAQRQLHEQRFASQEFQIITVDGQDVGILSMAVTPNCVHVHQLFLLPEHQGQGIGHRCMERILEEARPMGLPVRLRVLKVNPRARVFYERLGFEQTGETETHDLMERAPGSQPTPDAERPGPPAAP